MKENRLISVISILKLIVSALITILVVILLECKWDQFSTTESLLLNGATYFELEPYDSTSFWLVGDDSYISGIAIDIPTVISGDDYVGVQVINEYPLENENRVEYEGRFDINSFVKEGSYYLEIPKVKLVFGREYLISITNGSCNTLLLRNGAGSISITTNRFDKKVLFLLKVFCYVLIPALAISVLSKITYGLSVTGYLLISTLTVYFFGIAGKLKFSYNYIVLISMSLVAIFLWKLLERKVIFEKKQLLSFVYVALIFLFILVTCKQNQINKGDDFIHWALWVKEAYIFDKIPIHDRSTVYSLRYPPFYSLMQYWFIKINGCYSEYILFISKRLFEFVVGFTIFERLKNNVAKVCSVMFAVLLPFFFFTQNVIDSNFSDTYLGCVVGLALIAVFELASESKFINIACAVGLGFLLPLVKETGLFCAGCIFATCCVQALIVRKENSKKWIISGFTLMLGTFLGQMSWNVYLNRALAAMDTSMLSDRQKNLGNTLQPVFGSIFNFVKGDGQSYQYETMANYISKLFVGAIVQIRGIINVPFIAYVIAIVCVVCVSYGWTKKEKNCNYNVLTFNLIFLLVMTAFLLAVYVFMYTRQEQQNLTSMDRYLGSFLLATVLSVAWKCADSINEEKIIFGFGTLYVILACVLTNGFSYYCQSIIVGNDKNNCITTDLTTDVIRNVVREDETVYYISSEGAADCEWHKFQYELAPARVNSRWFYEENEWHASYMPSVVVGRQGCYCISEEELIQQIKKCEYLYIGVFPEHLDSEYPKLASLIDSEANGILYRVIEDNDECFMEQVQITRY